MAAQDRTFSNYVAVPVQTAAYVTSGNTETPRITAPNALSGALLQNQKMSAMYPTNEVWIPVGIWFTVTVTITVTAPVLTLRKNGVTSSSGGAITIPLQANTTPLQFAAFSDWSSGFASAPAAGDAWSVIVTTTSTAGTLNPVWLCYGIRVVTGVNDGILF